MLLPILIHDISNNNAPLNILKLFQLKNLQQTYVQHGIIHLGEFLGTCKRCFSRFGEKLWNEISCSLRNLPKGISKGRISPTSLIYFSKKTHYIETPIIIQKVGLAK